MRQAKENLIEEQPLKWTSRVGQSERRMKTIAGERILSFLSRKAVIPKYGFPVDGVELDTRPQDGKPTGVSLQRDLSQAIAEYAPGGKVVANKLEWQSCGIKTIPEKAWPVRHYQYDDARNFSQWNEGDPEAPSGGAKYLSPTFGFVTPLFEQPKEPRGRARRLYTTRPFFQGFGNETEPERKTIVGVQLTKAMPGTLVILCEGRSREGFHICRSCGAHMTEAKGGHKSPLELHLPGYARTVLARARIGDGCRALAVSATDGRVGRVFRCLWPFCSARRRRWTSRIRT